MHLLRSQLDLLDHGYLLEAKDLEDSRDTAADESESVDDTDSRYATFLQDRVASVLAEGAHDCSKTIAARSTQIKQYRDQIIGAFFARCGGARRCTNCKGTDRRVVAQHSTVVIALALKPKDRQRMEMIVSEWDTTADSTDGPTVRGVDDGETNHEGIEDTSSSSDESDDNENDEQHNVDEGNDSSSSSDDGSDSDGSSNVELDPDAGTGGSGRPAGGRFGRETLTAEWVFQHLKQVWEQDGEVLSRLFRPLVGRTAHGSGAGPAVDPHEFLFMKLLPVAPSRFRPAARMGEQIFENGRTIQLTAVVKATSDLVEKYTEFCNGGAADGGLRYIRSWHKLQQCVNEVVDSNLNPTAGIDATGGVKQVLEKKEGLFRKHMMGKRVNYACRSVISPDPMIGENEIGIPEVFALKLTYPETVTELNFNTLRAAVLNGPDVHPGATHVLDEFGNLSVLSGDRSRRVAIAKQLMAPPKPSRGQPQQFRGKQVYRHIRNGDYVLANRQPTLHKASIMAHRARVLRGERTLRLHYANCKSYNADFDGDEMNVHFPQTELGRAEAAEIMHTQRQYVEFWPV